MSSQPQQPPPITPSDRLALTLCLAIISHAIIVLGVTFASEDPPVPRYDTMEIILVQQKSERQDDAELLAQANLEGGGDTSEDVLPATPLPPPFPDNEANLTTPRPSSPPETKPKPEPAEKTEKETDEPPADTQEMVAVKTEQAEQQTTDHKKEKPQPKEEKVEEEKQQQQKTDKPTATELLTNSFKVASLSAQIKRRLEARANRPRREFISASTKEFKYAAYMEAWRAKVERIGNLNYPEEARRRNLSGELVLEVALSKDGSIDDIIVRRSSGHKLLDDAAMRIVRLAAPYAPFPDGIREETDILHITRTWQFLNKRGFR